MLKKKVVVVTGGGGLLGRQFCESIASNGGIAIVADINEKQANLVAETIRQSGGDAAAHFVDITSLTSVQTLIESIMGRYGHIDAVVNNAYPRNANYGRTLEEVTYADFCANLSLHLGGYFLVAQQFAINFSRNGGGVIINMGSIYGVIAPRFDVYQGTAMTMPVEYAAIKAAISHLTRYFAQYYKKAGLRINTLSPGGIFDHQPDTFLANYKSLAGTKGMLDGMDMVGSLLYLLSDASKFVTGQEIIVDDGYSL